MNTSIGKNDISFWLVCRLQNKYNKLFKSDSQRVAFLLCVALCD
nr:hypothetical protein [Vibrio vulnificus]